jgi:ABC-2 type transport system ATP-binding protein
LRNPAEAAPAEGQNGSRRGASPFAGRHAIQLQGVTKVYPGPVLALDNVTLEVDQGEHCCLLGPNGAGKTTIIRLLQGALKPTKGELRILGPGGTPPWGRRAAGRALLEAKRHVGVVPQNPGLYPDLTVREYLQLVRRLYGRGDPGRTASKFGLEEYLRRPLAALSGGQQRRLLVAAAVLTEPSLLLLDEPTVGLDPLAAAEIRGLLRSAMRGRTVLMSTHNLAEADELCSTVIILRRGTVLVHERIEDLRRQVAPQVHLAARQGAAALARALEGMEVPCTANEDGLVVQAGNPEQTVPDLLRRLLAAGLDVYECRIAPPTLEDLFVDLVTRA